MTNMDDPDHRDPLKVSRAFEMADEAMTELLRAHCALSSSASRSDAHPEPLYPTGEDCGEVCALSEASAIIKEAVEWLRPRGLVAVHRDTTGEFLVLLGQP